MGIQLPKYPAIEVYAVTYMYRNIVSCGVAHLHYCLVHGNASQDCTHMSAYTHKSIEPHLY